MSDYRYIYLIGRLGITGADGVDADEDPNTIWCDSGVVRFTPVNTYTKAAAGVAGSPLPWQAGQAVMDVPLDSSGYLTLSGARRVRFVDLTDADSVNPVVASGRATHKIEYRQVTAQGTTVSYPPDTVRIAPDTARELTAAEAAAVGLPEGTLACVLSELTTLPTAGGTPIIQGPRGTGIASLAVEGVALIATLDDGSEVSTDLPAPLVDSDAAVAALVEGPDTATASALNEAIAGSTGGAAALKVVAGTTAPGLGIYPTLAAACVAAADGATITVAPGAHAVDTTPLMTGVTNVTINMAGATITVAPGTDAAPVEGLRIEDCAGITVTGGHFVGDGGDRNGSNHAVHVYNSTKVTVDGVEAEGLRCFGVLVAKTTGAVVRNCFVHDTKADGIHFTFTCLNFSATANVVTATGDDGIAVVSYVADGAPCDGFVIAGNIISAGLARGITVAGGRNGVISGNQTSDTAGAGVIILRDSGFNTYGVTDITVTANQINGAGQTINNGGVHVIGSWDVAYPVSRVRILSNNIIGALRRGISVTDGTTAHDVELRDNNIVDAAFTGIALDVGDNCVIAGNTVVKPGSQGVFVSALVTGTLRLTGNTVRDPNQTQAPVENNDAFDIHGDATTLVYCDDNIVLDTTGYSEWPFVFYACPDLRYGPGNVIRSTGAQTSPAFAASTVVASQAPRTVIRSAAPTTGTWEAGSIAYVDSPSAGGNVGWVCVVGGTPGTWKSFGTIAA